MRFLEMDDDMTEPQKQSFVQRWERSRRRGMVFFIVRTIVLATLFLGVLQLFDPLFNADPFVLATWTQWFAGLDVPSFFIMTTITGSGIGLLFWFIGEELYKNFK
jgi:hypothetical protein